MILEKYPLIADEDHLSYEFLSQGLRGTVKKVVHYKKIGDNLYNLGFGDWDETHQKVNDKVRSDNNDKDKVLATVAATVIDFIANYPDATIFAMGSTPGRTRLYQMGIFSNLQEINDILDIHGFADRKWMPFRKGINYEAFIVEAKKM